MFHPFRLLSLAAQAEGLRLKRIGRGYAFQAGYGVGAALCALFLLGMLHVAGFVALERSQGGVWAALIVAFIDLVLAAILGFMARSRGYDPVEREAYRVRQTAVRQVTDTGARIATLAPLLRSQSAKKGLIGAAVTAVIVGFLSRR